MFQRTTTINKLLKLTKRKKVIQGGTSSGKTYAIIPILIDYATKNPRKRITIVAESIPAVKDGAVKIFKDIMMDTNRWVEDRWLGNPMEYTFANKTVIQFKSFDSVGKAKASGKRDILFLNEGNHIPFEIADALMIRSIETWIDFNPTATFWAHTEVLNEPNSEHIILTYLDNEACPPETIEDLMIKKAKAEHSDYWANWWKVYGLGELGTLQGVIFQNWTSIDSIPVEAELIGLGMDFGYTNDPTTMIACYKLDGAYIWDEVIYQKGLLNSEIANLIKSKGFKDSFIFADSAEPKSIAELRSYGLTIRGAEKGKDSINFGIAILQEQQFKVTARSHNLIKELRSYMWEIDREGKETNKPIDIYNHCIDAMRYLAISKLTTKKRSLVLGFT